MDPLESSDALVDAGILSVSDSAEIDLTDSDYCESLPERPQ